VIRGAPRDRSPTAALDPRIAHELIDIVVSGDAVLFTGAGFSIGARDITGVPLPDSEQMRRELWRLVFEDDRPDDSTLADLYDVALARAPDALAAYLAHRLCVGQLPASRHHATWFAMPWRRIYTLNVDDLEAAVQREFALPRRLRTISALSPGPAPGDRDAIDVVHLNGVAGDGTDALTFSTLQYAARLCGQDREYAALAEDLARWPFVFTGTTLDEVVLWQHLELHRRGSGRPVPARPSYLIARTLSRARQLLLENLGLTWLRATVEDVAALLAPDAAHRG
jgi:hypothetical protein